MRPNSSQECLSFTNAPDTLRIDLLNDEQRDAVQHRNGPLLVLAGAGSGKTRVITYRIAHLIADGVPARSILAVTFTNKAAREMRERTSALLHREGDGLWVGTFHSVCARLLRSYGDSVGLSRGFVVYDSDDQKTLVRRILKDHGISERMFGPRDVLSHIDKAKNKGVNAARYRPTDFFSEIVSKVYPEYERRLLAANATDFGNLLLKTQELLEQNTDIRDHLAQSFSHLLVDEFQDTNLVQYKLVRLLSGQHNNLCVVGDDDQSIYSWRGANIANILEFEADHPNAKVIRLEQNYRSSQNILDAADAIIARNVGRKGKTLWTDAGPGEPIKIVTCADERREAEFVAQTINKLRETTDCTYGDFAVFYRTHAQSRVLEEALRSARSPIPHIVVGGIRFYDRAEVKDLLAYLRLMINPCDDLALQRIVNVPKRGIGKTTMERLASFARQRQCSLWDAARACASGTNSPVSRAASKRISQFCELIDELSTTARTESASIAAEQALEASGYRESLALDGSIEAQTRAENLMELLGSINDFETTTDDPTLLGFLEHVALTSTFDDVDPSQGAVTLMTVHGAKGLEFPVVMIVGLEQGVFPHARSLNDLDQLEEERRLAYVAITRAMKRLFLTHAQQRWMFGDRQVNPPSEFLRQIPEQLIESTIVGTPRATSTVNRRPSRSERPSRGPNDVWVDYGDAGHAGFDDHFDQSSDESSFFIGMQVSHSKFGLGEVRMITGSAPNYNLTIYFQRVGPKTVRAQYVQRV